MTYPSSFPNWSANNATADAVFPLTQVSNSSPITIPCTAANSVIGFITSTGSQKQSVMWLGGGTADITSLVINVYEFSVVTGEMTWLCSSLNLINSVPNPMSWNYFQFNPEDFILSEPGDVYAVEMVVEGTGTYSVAGLTDQWVTGVPGEPQQTGAFRGGEVAFDSVGPGYSGTVSADSVDGVTSHTPSEGATVLVQLGVNVHQAISDFTIDVTYNGVAMELLGQVTNNNITGAFQQLYSVSNAAGSEGVIAFTISGSSTIYAVTVESVSYLNVSDVSVTTAYGNSSTGKSKSTTLSNGEVMFSCYLAGNVSPVSSSNFTGNTRATGGSGVGSDYIGALVGDVAAQSYSSDAEPMQETMHWSGSIYWSSITATLTPQVTPSQDGPPTYCQNTPWFGLSELASTPLYDIDYAVFNAQGTYTFTLPEWVVNGNYVDVVILGAGAGGQVGGEVFGLFTGQGGGAGKWTTKTLTVGTDLATTDSLTIVVGAGGTRGVDASKMSGSPGGDSTVTYGTTTLTADGGTNANPLIGGDLPGQSPGDKTFNGVVYHGGAQQSTYGASGNPPGGGGQGGRSHVATYSQGGTGADGSVWIMVYQ